MIDLVTLLQKTLERGGSDLHLSVFAPPMARVNGRMMPLTDFALVPDTCRDLILGILTESQRARLEEDWELDFALSVEGLGRFRANAHFSKGCLEAAFRYIPNRIPELKTLGHREAVHQLCTATQGLILVTGVTGSGKSTTLASMVQAINSQRTGVIVTIEDPIEFLFESNLCIIKQREIGSDTHSFAEGLKRALRQDPDVILVGELRDLETIRAAITAAETGHLVLGTLHTIDAPKAIDRLVDVFPADQQGQIIAQLANCLLAVVSQRLLVKSDGKGRVMAEEIMLMNHAIRACIRERKFAQLVGLIEIGGGDGMNTIDESLAELFAAGVIDEEEVRKNARDLDRVLAARPVVAKKKGFFG